MQHYIKSVIINMNLEKIYKQKYIKKQKEIITDELIDIFKPINKDEFIQGMAKYETFKTEINGKFLPDFTNILKLDEQNKLHYIISGKDYEISDIFNDLSLKFLNDNVDISNITFKISQKEQFYLLKQALTKLSQKYDFTIKFQDGDKEITQKYQSGNLI